MGKHIDDHELDELLAAAEARAADHFEDVERAVSRGRLGELLKDLPPIEEQARQAREAARGHPDTTR
jgi:hypothetical protein